MNISLPNDVGFILDKLLENGFSAYIVGGCVRDALLLKTPTDWDICTNALPQQTINVFSDYKTIKTGIKHGTITLLINSVPYEITTFRTDGDYIDSRHPENVKYIRDIVGDLARRDFTVNAMAYNKKLVDLYDGQKDLENRIIRCVGDADKRFLEDALRIMRAIRFSAVLDFEIEEKTKTAIFSLKENLLNIAIERINTEFSKILLSDSKTVYFEYKEVFKLFFENFEKLNLNFGNSLTMLPKDLSTRLACLFLNLDYDKTQSEKTLQNLRYPSKIITEVLEIIENFEIAKYNGIKDMRLSLSKINEKALVSIIQIKNEDIEKALKMLSQIKSDNMCYRLSHLKISGDDLINTGIKNGELIGKILNRLLYLVINEEIENSKVSLLKKAEDLLEELK